jgi:predicted nucleic acid-binding protein
VRVPVLSSVEATTTRLRAARRFGGAICLSLTLLPAPAQAFDPLTMFLLGFARNLIESAVEAHRSRPAPRVIAPPTPTPKAAESLNEAELRALVDESFPHLTRMQREELLASLERTLADPANASQRQLILTQFVNVARQIQFTHVQLNRLSDEEKRVLAERFASNFRTLTPDQQQSLQEQLTQRARPLPVDLNDLMLAAVSTSR